MRSVSVHTSFFGSITKATSRPIRPCCSSPVSPDLLHFLPRMENSGERRCFPSGPASFRATYLQNQSVGPSQRSGKDTSNLLPLSDSPLLLICFLLLQTRRRLVLLFGSQCRFAVNWTCRNTFTPPAAAVKIQGREYNDWSCCSVVFLHPNVSNKPHRSNSVSGSRFICRLLL